MYLIDSFFGVLSAFKGRIRSNLAMIRDQSRPNWIAIESKRRGVVKNSGFCSKLLNSFTIQSRVKKRRRRKLFYKRNNCENCGLFDSLKTDQRPWSRDDRGPRSHDPSKIACSILIGRPWCVHMTPHDHRSAIKSRAFDVHLCDRLFSFTHVPLMAIGWTRVHAIDVLYLTLSHAIRHTMPRVLQFQN